MRNLEAPSGFEPLNRGFAVLPLSHLGTAPCTFYYTSKLPLVFQEKGTWNSPMTLFYSPPFFEPRCPEPNP